MSLTDLLQTISLLAVAITIILAAVQNRHAASQSREVARQSTLADTALEQTAHQMIVGSGSTVLTALITSEPDLLAWFLASRGIPPASAEMNKRYLLMYLRMEVHEATYLAHLEGSLSDDVWGGWRRVIELDSATPEFLAIWPVVSDSYSARFGKYVNETIVRRALTAPPPRLSEPPGPPIDLDQQVPENVVEL